MLSKNLQFFLKLAKAQAVLNRRFDTGLAGLGLNEFIVMTHLTTAPGGRLRPMDLAEKIGLTPSGITRLLRPMEKVGYIRRASDEHDARVSYVVLGSGGTEKYATALENAEHISEQLLGCENNDETSSFSKLLDQISI